MARAFSVSDLVTRVRRLGDWVEAVGADYSESYMSDEIVIEALSVANAETHEQYALSDEDYGSVRTTFDLVSGSTYTLPSDFLKSRAVEFRPSDGTTGWSALSRATLDDNLADGESGDPDVYRLISGSIELIPTPSAGTLRLTYVPCAPTLTTGTQQVDGVDGFDNLTVLRAVRFLKMREGLSTAEWDNMIMDAERKMERSVRRRDRSAPRRLRDPRAGRLTWSQWRRR